jgi:DNA modification methylase
MKSHHCIYFENSLDMSKIPSESVDLVVTSPPYPMIAMWDELFSARNEEVGNSLDKNNGIKAFELMHGILDSVWMELWRVVKDNGFVCINIGDATRNLNEVFSLYPNHARVISKMLGLGFNPIPGILWSKLSNAPNKFMGSGMLPPGAYVTMEHEHILIFRKGGKREFTTNIEKGRRRESAFFWEERNVWFSDIWTDLRGMNQKLSDAETRKRSASFPFELPYRLINMFSLKGDTVLDPFLGIGTTSLAAISTGRNSIGYELETGFKDMIFSGIDKIIPVANGMVDRRIENHLSFVEERKALGKEVKHINKHYNFPVVTKQETDLVLEKLVSVKKDSKNLIEVKYI